MNEWSRKPFISKAYVGQNLKLNKHLWATSRQGWHYHVCGIATLNVVAHKITPEKHYASSS